VINFLAFEARFQVFETLVLKEDFSLEVDREEVWRYMHTRNPLRSLDKEVDWARKRARELAQPKAATLRLVVEGLEPEGVVLNGGAKLESPRLSEYFQGAEYATLMGLTIGPQAEEEANGLFAKGDMVKGLALDAAATALVHRVSDQLHRQAFGEAEKGGMKMGPCLSPGGAAWDLTGQRVLFPLLHLEELGFRLLESCFMYPRKSVTRVLPMGRELVVRSSPDESRCRYCTNTYCLARRE
jgi:hypothetical protein